MRFLCLLISDHAIDTLVSNLPAIAGVIATLITSITAAVASIMALRQGVANGVKADIQAQKTDDIHALANSNLKSQTEALAHANTRIEDLHRQLSVIAVLPASVQAIDKSAQ